MKIKMKRSIIILFALFAISTSFKAFSQQLAKELFVSMPDSLLPTLTAVNRADCIDFLESNMKARVENRFGKTSEMVALGDDYIKMEMTPNSTWQMKLLSINDSTQVISTITTVCAPVCDSNIKFYDTKWNELPTKNYIPVKPTIADFVNLPDSAATEEMKNDMMAIDVLLTEAQFNKEDNNLVFNFTTPQYIEKEKAEKLKTVLRPSIIYSWNNNQLLPLQASVDE